jgi:ubiquinone/menaquinone biosynthesis C-methylase UbiE
MVKRLGRGYYRRIVDDLVDVVPEGGDVLDVGTGPGLLLVELAARRRDIRIVGIDLSADMVAFAQRNTRAFGDRVSARVADVAQLPLADNSVDVVVTSASIRHWDNHVGSVLELDRVLRPGGRLYIYDLGMSPFEELAEAAHDRGILHARPVRRTRIRTGTIVLPTLVRQVMTA